MPRPQNVTDYIAHAPRAVQPRLRSLRALIKKAVPKAEEKLSYGMPYYGYHGRLAYFAYFKNHIGLYLTPPIVKQFKKELKDYATSTATIRFPNDQPLPLVLITKLLKARVKLNQATRKRICSRGHEFIGKGPCPKCWPGSRASSLPGRPGRPKKR